MNLDNLTKDAQVILVLCNQWGDTGKGKFADYFAEGWADVVIKGTGGNNAGHTKVTEEGRKIISHLLPASISIPGKYNILGNGMVIDPFSLLSELDEVELRGTKDYRLAISEDAHLTLPYHVEFDRKKDASQEAGSIGSTGRGIGPTYTDKIARKGVMVRDLFNRDVLAKKVFGRLKHFEAIQKGEQLQKLLDNKNEVGLDELLATRVDLNQETEKILASLEGIAERLEPFVTDTFDLVHKLYSKGKKILGEGAQGLLLSVELGTYPYVTSSDCSANGTATGMGLPAKVVDHTFGIVKFPYMTRVGAGPFPSELGGKASEEYCALGLEHDIIHELERANVPFERTEENISYDFHHPNIIALMNSRDPFEKGIGIRLAGGEYGATTGRPRRTGWTDISALRFATRFNGPEIILTKVDVLQGADEFCLAEGYSFTRDSEQLRGARPSLTYFQGFDQDLLGCTQFGELPKSLVESINYLQRSTKTVLRAVSTGPKASQTIVL